MKKLIASFSQRRFFKYLSISALFLVSLAVLFFSTYITERNEFMDATADFLESSREEIDKNVSQKLIGYLNSALNEYSQAYTLKTFFEQSEDNYIFEVSMRSTAEATLRKMGIEGKIIMYRSNENKEVRLISTDSSEVKFNNQNPAYNYLVEASIYVKEQIPGFFVNSSREVIYYYPVGATSSDSRFQNCVIVILSDPLDIFSAGTADLNPKAGFVTLDGFSVLSREGNAFISDDFLGRITNEGKGRPHTFFRSRLNDEISGYYFYQMPSQESDLTYLYYEPVKPFIFYFTEFVKSPWAVPLIIAYLLIALFFALATIYKRMYSGNAPAEYTEEKDKSFKYITGILEGNPLEMFKGSEQPNNGGILIEFTRSDSHAVDNDVHKRIVDAVNQFLLASSIHYKLQPHEYTLCCYFNFTEYNMRVMSDSLKQILYTVIDSYNFNLYYTEPFSDINDLLLEMNFLLKSVVYSKVLGYNRRFASQFIKLCDKTDLDRFQMASVDFKTLLDSKRYNEACALLQTYSDGIAGVSHGHRYYSYSSLYRFSEELFCTLKNFYAEANYNSEILSMSTDDALLIANGLEGCLHYMISSLAKYKEESESGDKNTERSLISAVLNYVDENLSTASLNGASEYFHVSSAHLSRLFKKERNINFSDYVSEKRLTKAAEMLVQDTNMSISDISEKLGYGTPTYFLAKFKERYSTTPSAYRKNYFTTRK